MRLQANKTVFVNGIDKKRLHLTLVGQRGDDTLGGRSSDVRLTGMMRKLESAIVLALMIACGCGSDPQPNDPDTSSPADVAPDVVDVPDRSPDISDNDVSEEPDVSVDDSDETVIYRPIFQPEDESFFSQPWPLDSRLDDDGHPDLSGFPGVESLTEPFLTAIETGVFGYGLSPVVFFQFDELPPESAFPSTLDSTDPDSPIQLIALERGRCTGRTPIEFRLWAETDGYAPAHTLALSPVPGVVLQPLTTYAVIMRTDLGAPHGETVMPAVLESVLGETSDYPELEAAFGPLIDCIEAGDLSVEDLAAATVFTTGDPSRELARMAEVASASPGQLDELEWTSNWRAGPEGTKSASSHLQMPVFQAGEMPYSEGGGLVLDDAGLPVIQRWDEVPIHIAWPFDREGPFPVVVWVPGSGGDWETTLDYPVAEWLLQNGVAIAAFDSQFHGDRNPTGADAGLASFNYTNPTAGRNVLRQQAVELLYFLDAIEGADLDIESGLQLEGLPSVGGHSQGALVGALAAGVDTDQRAYLLAATGGHVALSALGRTQPFDVRQLLEVTFDAELDRFHPLMAMLQLGSEVVDPLAYAANWYGSTDTAGRHVFVVNGDEDAYVPKATVDALTIASALPIAAPAGWSVGQSLEREPSEVAIPATDTVAGHDGSDLTSAVLNIAGEDHFLIYEHGRALALATSFLVTAASGQPTIDELCQAIPLNDHVAVEDVSWFVEDEFSRVGVRLRENDVCPDSGSTSRSYEFTAPRSGTYRLDSDVDDFAVNSTCFPLAAPEGCADGSSLDVEMEAGESIFIEFASGHGTDLTLAVGLTGVEEGDTCSEAIQQCAEGLICLRGICSSACSAPSLNNYPTGEQQWGETITFPGIHGVDSGIWPLPATCRDTTLEAAEIPYQFTPPTGGTYLFSTGFEGSEASAYVEVRSGCQEEGETLACAGNSSPTPSTVAIELVEDVTVTVVLHAANTFSHGKAIELRAGLIRYGEADAACDNLTMQCATGLACVESQCRSDCATYSFNDFEVAEGEWVFEGHIPGLSGHDSSTIAWPETCEYSNTDQSGDVSFAFTAPSTGLFVFRGGFDDRAKIDISVADSCSFEGDFVACAEDTSSNGRAPLLDLELEADQEVVLLVSATSDSQNGNPYQVSAAEVQWADAEEACDGEVVRCSEGAVCIENVCRDECEAFVLNDFRLEDGSFSHTTVFPGFRGEDAGIVDTPLACSDDDLTSELTYAFTAPSAGTWVFTADDIEGASRPILWRMTSCDSDPADEPCFEEGEVPTMSLVLVEEEEVTIVVEPSSQLRQGRPVLVTATRTE